MSVTVKTRRLKKRSAAIHIEYYSENTKLKDDKPELKQRLESARFGKLSGIIVGKMRVKRGGIIEE